MELAVVGVGRQRSGQQRAQDFLAIIGEDAGRLDANTRFYRDP